MKWFLSNPGEKVKTSPLASANVIKEALQLVPAWRELPTCNPFTWTHSYLVMEAWSYKITIPFFGAVNGELVMNIALSQSGIPELASCETNYFISGINQHVVESMVE